VGGVAIWFKEEKNRKNVKDNCIYFSELSLNILNCKLMAEEYIFRGNYYIRLTRIVSYQYLATYDPMFCEIKHIIICPSGNKRSLYWGVSI
jgi:hypothetical protein